MDPPADQGPLRRRTECERSGDSKPNLKDSALRGADINMAETYKHYYEYDDVDEAYYQSYHEDEIYMDDYEEVDYT